MNHRIGVCSWSLRAASAAELVERVQRCGLDAVQLALDPIRRGDWPEKEAIDHLRRAGISILSGMMAPAGEDYTTLDTIRVTGGVRSDEHWPANLVAARANAYLAEQLGIKLVTFHGGFLSNNPRDPLRAVMLDRLRGIADAFASKGIAVALESGQEGADSLLAVLAELDRPSVGVNFDPANIILYGVGEPVAALRKLAPHVKQVHIKDAIPTARPGTWGRETVVGEGAVNWRGIFDVISSDLPQVNLVIEREARQERLDDIRAAHRLIMEHLARPSETVHG